jgi:hypothetical protein
MSRATFEQVESRIRSLRSIFQGKLEHWARQSDARPTDYYLLGELRTMGYVLMCMDDLIEDYLEEDKEYLERE